MDSWTAAFVPPFAPAGMPVNAERVSRGGVSLTEGGPYTWMRIY